MSQSIYAEYNHGRWVAICPACLQQGVQIASEVRVGDVFVCPTDYPNLLAQTLVPNPRMNGAFNPVADTVLREETRQRAIADGAAHEVIFPSGKNEIERLLRVRPLHARNWFPGVTVEELQQENERMKNA